MTTQRHNDYTLIRHTLIVRTGMTVHISRAAVNAHNARTLPDHTGRVGFNDRPVQANRDYEIIFRVGSSCELRDAVTGLGGVWFNVSDLIFIVHYQGYTIKGKINHRAYAPGSPSYAPWVAEVYTPDGAWVDWVYVQGGLWASMRAAADVVDETTEGR